MRPSPRIHYCMRPATVLLLLACASQRAMADYSPPTGGWDYIYNGDAAASSTSAALDGTWDHDNSFDEWDGSAPGAGNPGGLGIVPVAGEAGNNALLMVDAVTVSGNDNNRRLALTHDLAAGQGVPGDFLDDGATISFRARLPSDAPDLGGGPNGLDPPSGQKGIFNIRQDSGRLSFSLGIAGTDSAYPQSGMLITDGAAALHHPLNPALWNEFWITIVQNGGDSSRYDLKLYLNGSATAAWTASVALNAAAEEIYPYLSLQLSSSAQTAAVEIDYFAFKDGLHPPGASDGDSLPDGWELTYFPDLSQGDGDDPDLDGLTNIQEFNAGSNPTLLDTDGDELRDGDEFNIHNTDPILADTDGDGLEDGEEINALPPTDPTESDTDGDGLDDGAEVNGHGTDPTLADSDGDSFSDGVEVAVGSDPLDGNVVPSFPTLDGVLISEFMAANNVALLDEDGDSSDWIELWNPTGAAVPIGGWYLTDDPADPTKWQLPPGLILGAGEFLVIFASGKDRAILGQELHTDFNLDKMGGSHLALTMPDGLGGALVVSAYGLYPKQEDDVSYGAYGNASPLSVGHFLNSTPGGANGQSAVEGFVKDTMFDPKRGFYDTPLTVKLSTGTPGATLIYTMDGTLPAAGNGTVVAAPDANTAPFAMVPINTTTCLRAIGIKSGFEPTNVDTHTYIFASRVLRQDGRRLGGVNWGHSGPEWDMDREVVTHPSAASRVVASDLMTIPTISLVLPFDDFFGSGGIYISGESVERNCSIEYLNPEQNPADPNSAQGFQVDGTVQIAGGSSTGRWKSNKLSMRLKFSPDLRYPIFEGAIDGEGATRRFDTLVLDARLNNVWTHPSSGQNILGQYTRDQYVADLQNAMSGPAPHGRPVHVYIRGIYWGMYPMHERPDDNFGAEYTGGDNDDYDAMKHRDSSVVHGSATNWNRLTSLSSRDMSIQSNYDAVARMLDVEQMIDYLLVNFYCGNTDWSHQNWYATFNKVVPDGRWQFHSWDPEHTLKGTGDNVTGDSRGGATRLNSRLKANPEYRLLFADHIHRHFFNDGVLTPGNAAAKYQARIDTVNEAVRCESARWGDSRRSTPYLRGVEWMNEYNRLMNSYFPGRTRTVFNQLRNQNLYPDTDAPEFNPHGGAVPGGFDLTITERDGGSIYYTLDGSDPRVPAGAAEVMTHTLVGEFASKRAFMPVDGSLENTWFTEGFNDNGWPTGTQGAGYEDDGRYDPLLDPNFDFIGQISDNNQETLYTRIAFEVADPALYDDLVLKMRFDDGFVAYLNGVEIERENAPGSEGTLGSWDEGSSDSVADDDAEVFQSFQVADHLGLLKAGTNVLAVQGLNRGVGSSDFLIWAMLEAVQGVGGEAGGLSNSAILYQGPVRLTTPGPVKARVLSGNEWSAITEATFLVDVIPAEPANLVISKIHYRPAAPSAAELAAGHNNRNDFEYVELMNVGPQTIDLYGVRFTEGLEFYFSEGSIRFLDPGQRILVVENEAAFALRYGVRLPVTGEFAFETELENAGEQLVLVATNGSEIHNFVYDDQAPWPESPDGDGFALVLIDPDATPDHGMASSWQASASIGGNPGDSEGLGFLAWQAQSFIAADLANPAISGMLANPDGDLTTNLEEFLFGGDPGAFDSAEILPFITVEEIGNESYAVVHIRVQTVVIGISWQLTSSIDAAVWSPADLVPLSSIDLGGGTVLRRFRMPAPLPDPANSIRLFRVEIDG
jgi:hypothetical protein